MKDISIGGAKVNPVLLALAAGAGLLMLIVTRGNNQAADSGTTTLSTDDGAAAANALSSLQNQVQTELGKNAEDRAALSAGLSALAQLSKELRDSMSAATPPAPASPTNPMPAGFIPVSMRAVAGVDYDPNGQAALIADLSGPTPTASGKWIVTDNWQPFTLPTPVVKAVQPVVTPATITPAAPTTPVLEGLPVINPTKPTGGAVVVTTTPKSPKLAGV